MHEIAQIHFGFEVDNSNSALMGAMRGILGNRGEGQRYDGESCGCLVAGFKRPPRMTYLLRLATEICSRKG